NAAIGMLGTKMATYQSAGVALPVNQVLVTEAGEIAKELYLSVLVDRGSKSITFIASSEGGVDIETVAAETPHLIQTLNVKFVEGLQPYQARNVGFALGLTAKQTGQLVKIMTGLYRPLNDKDPSLVELTPLATMDVIKLSGGEPANFLDVGGGATKERVTTAFKLILSSDKVKAIFVNIFGGIVRCDMIAEGIIAAVKDVGVKVPVIVRLEGTNVEAGKDLLKNSGLAIIAADDINDGARKAVAAVK